MSNSSEDKPTSESAAGVRHAALSRRGLLKGGAGLAPVVLTLTSRPVLATGTTGGTCPTQSAFASLNISGHTHAGRIACSGKSPDHWDGCQASEWPSPNYTPSKMFNSLPDVTQLGTDKNLLDILNDSSSATKIVLRHIVASLLNAKKGSNTGFMTEAQIKLIWNNYKGSGGGTFGFWEPSTGIRLFYNKTEINGREVTDTSNIQHGGIVGWLQENYVS